MIKNTLLKHIVICSAPHAAYVAHLVDYSLKSIGIISSIRYEKDDNFNENLLHIVICPGFFKALPRFYIAFQLEQLENLEIFTESYRSILKNSLYILDYALPNIKFLENLGFSSLHMRHMPISFFPNYREYLGNFCSSEIDFEPEPVLFYGSLNERRTSVINRLNPLLEASTLNIQSNIFLKKLYKILVSTKIVINIHHYENSFFEVVRIFECLSLGVPVISEESQDSDAYPSIEDAVDFFPVKDATVAALHVKQLLSDPSSYDNRLKNVQDYGTLNSMFTKTFLNFFTDFSANFGEFVVKMPPVVSTLANKEIAKSQPPIACVAVVKNEEKYIAEWITYQFSIGFDTVIILDNLSTDRTKDVALQLGYSFDVRVLDATDITQNYQRSAYLLALERYGKEFEWMAFFDTDEFLVLDEAHNLRSILWSASAISGIGVNWAFFGSSGHQFAPPSLVLDSYLHRAPASFTPNRHIKSIVKPIDVKNFINGHMFELSTPYCDLAGKEILWNSPGIIANEPDYLVGKLHHYFTRSQEDWAAKLRRGYPDLDRKNEEFSAYDRNEIYDDSARRFSSSVSTLLAQAGSYEKPHRDGADRRIDASFLGTANIRKGASTLSDMSSTQLERSFVNLALAKSATQSSVSLWSRSTTIHDDASGAVNGVINGQYKFHTDLEDYPWWMVDLEEICGLHEIKIYNRLDDPDLLQRASHLKIEVGLTGDQLVEFYRKDNDTVFGGVDGTPLVWAPSIPVIGRFVKITLLRPNYLHLDQVEIYGEAIFQDAKKTTSIKYDTISQDERITMVVTSCGRYDLLERTLSSFRRYNTCASVEKVIVVEDGEGDPKEICRRYDADLVRVGSRKGQSHAIDLAYSFVKTPYIFHCEDDWEFYKSGFIERSLSILKYDLSCVCIWIRAWNDTNGHPLTFQSDDKTFGVLSFGYGEWHGFTWNPSLRRLSDYFRVGPFSQEYNKISTLREPDVGQLYYDLGYRAVILDQSGYVRHIGWERHVH